MMNNSEQNIYLFNDDDIKLAQSRWDKAIKSVEDDEREKFEYTYHSFLCLCFAIVEPNRYINEYGYSKYSEIMQLHLSQDNIILIKPNTRLAKLALETKRILCEMSLPKARQEKYKRDDTIQSFKKAINPYQ